MKKTHLIFVAAVILAAVAYYFVRRGGAEHVTVDLVTLYDSADLRPAERREALFKKGPETVAGVTRPSIYMHPTSRMTFKKQLVPDHGRLRAWIAVKEEAWTQDGTDGVLFRFGVVDGRDYFELLNQHVDPRHNTNDRGWQPVDVDLSAYAGQEVDLVFNMNTSLPGRGDNGAYDFAVWGEPAIIERP